jgi:multicomponent Na+:H+ antiporter subunit G
MTVVEILACMAILSGLFFSVVGIIGIMRMPDVYSRIHASGKVAVLGIIGLLIGAALLMPQIALKALALAVFMVVTSPVASHAIASAAYRQDTPVYTREPGAAPDAQPSADAPQTRP